MSLKVVIITTFVAIIVNLDGNGAEDSSYVCNIQQGSSEPAVRQTITLPRINGGKVVESTTQVPWQALIQVKNRSEICGGSIIGPKLILSAAHCFFTRSSPYRKFDASDIKVTVGTVKRSALSATAQQMAVERVEIHYSYQPGNFDYDFALVHLSTAIRQSNSSKAVCLLKSCEYERTGWLPYLGIISGWGASLSSGDNYMDDLYFATLAIPPRNECLTMTDKSGIEITDRMICGGNKDNSHGAIDTCGGDGGGPMTVMWTVGVYVLEGISSWGVSCGEEGFYGVYSRPCSVMDWILGNKSTTTTTSSRRPPVVRTTTQFVETTEQPVTTAEPVVDEKCGTNLYSNTPLGNVRPKEFPWLARVVIYDSSKRRVIRTCGGTLINHWWVLTSGQCVQGADPSNIVVQFNVFDWSQSGDSINKTAQTVTVHDGYSSSTLDNNFGAIKLSSRIDYTEAIRPICITTDDCDSQTYENCYTVGWQGLSGKSGITIAKKATLKMATCSNSLRPSTDEKLCLQAGKGANNACQADMGGPLMCKDGMTFNLQGIASSAPNGCSLNSKVVYSKPCQALDWIRDSLTDDDE